jgi:hypothetical protein
MNHNCSECYCSLKVIRVRVLMNEKTDSMSLNPFLYKLRHWCLVIPVWAIREPVTTNLLLPLIGG